MKQAKTMPAFLILIIFLMQHGIFQKIGKMAGAVRIFLYALAALVSSETVLNVLQIIGADV